MYPLIGHYTAVPIADLTNLQSLVNRQDDTRKPLKAVGKRGGTTVLAEVTSGVYAMYISAGEGSSAAWHRIDGADIKTPVNLDPDNSEFTATEDAVYSDNLYEDGTGGGNVFQTVALKAGTYRGFLTLAGAGTPSAHTVPRIRINSGTVTSGVGATPVIPAIIGKAYLHPTDAELAVHKEFISYDFTLATDLSVTFTVDTVDETGAASDGEAYVEFSILEAVN